MGETWFIDFGLAAKVRPALVVAVHEQARLALASVLPLTTQFAGTPFELALPRVPWLDEPSYLNAQMLTPLKFTEFGAKTRGQFDDRVLAGAREILRRWLAL